MLHELEFWDAAVLACLRSGKAADVAVAHAGAAIAARYAFNDEVREKMRVWKLEQIRAGAYGP